MSYFGSEQNPREARSGWLGGYRARLGVLLFLGVLKGCHLACSYGFTTPCDWISLRTRESRGATQVVAENIRRIISRHCGLRTRDIALLAEIEKRAASPFELWVANRLVQMALPELHVYNLPCADPEIDEYYRWALEGCYHAKWFFRTPHPETAW